MKIICPVCNSEGYLLTEKRRNQKYLYVIHVIKENNKIKRKKHYIGKDLETIKEKIEQLINNKGIKKIIRYAGGDYWIANEILVRLYRVGDGKYTFVEVFGGSGYISQIIDRNKFPNIIYNDIDDKLTALYKMVKENPEEFVFLLYLLPYSRSFNKITRELLEKNRNLSELEAAALFFYLVNTSFMGGPKKGFGYSINPQRNIAISFKKEIRAILDFAKNWQDITIENLDFRKVIQLYDSEKTVFYLDPPYPDRSDNYYGITFTIKDFRDMANMLTKIKGKFLLKVDEKAFNLIKDILGNYKVEKLEKKRSMEKKKGEKKETWILIFVSNY
ncbi:MAG: DNA adenine methylase [Candidatus Nanopusillus sp.]